MKVQTVIISISLIVAIIVGISSYQQRVSVENLQIQVKHLTDKLKQQVQIGTEVKKQLTLRIESENMLLVSEKHKVSPPARVCEEAKPLKRVSLQGQVIHIYNELDGQSKVDALSELVTLDKLKNNKQTTKVFLDALKNSNPRVRRIAVAGVKKLKISDKLMALEPLIKDPSVLVRLSVLDAFDSLKSSPQERGAMVTRFLDDSNERILSMALVSIENLNYTDALPQIKQLLTDNENMNVVARAASVARSLGDDITADIILPRVAINLDSVLPRERLMALDAVAIVGGKAAIPYFKAALKDSNKDMRETAKAYLEDIDN